MKLTFLGTCDGHTSIGREHNGLLIESADGSLLADAGANVPQFLLRLGYPADFPEAFYLSHMHSDHTTHVASLIQSLWLRGRKAPLKLYAPAGVIATIRPWLEQSLLFPGLIGFTIDWQELEESKTITTPAGKLTPFATTHLHALQKQFGADHPSTCFDCYGFTLTSKRKRLVVSADLGAAQDLIPVLDQSTQALVVELAHFSIEDLAAVIAGKDITQVWLTHYRAGISSEMTSNISLLKKTGFSGELCLATDTLMITI